MLLQLCGGLCSDHPRVVPVARLRVVPLHQRRVVDHLPRDSADSSSSSAGLSWLLIRKLLRRTREIGRGRSAHGSFSGSGRHRGGALARRNLFIPEENRSVLPVHRYDVLVPHVQQDSRRRANVLLGQVRSPVLLPRVAAGAATVEELPRALVRLVRQRLGVVVRNPQRLARLDERIVLAVNVHLAVGAHAFCSSGRFRVHFRFEFGSSVDFPLLLQAIGLEPGFCRGDPPIHLGGPLVPPEIRIPRTRPVR
mmetsp:Transcript_3158/g.7388  ORF Transcript_3158/g.7388 Transcript_3158/m.7388 type:complete len:252 (+) Transcript_3158:521-1276(+)